MALSPHEAHIAVVFLVGFIAGVGIASGFGWVFRDRIRERLRRH